MEVQFTLNKEQEALRKQRLEVLKKSPEIKRWLANAQLDEAFLDAHSTKFYEWLTAIQKCQACSGLEHCH